MTKKLTIIGAGIIGAFEAYYAFKEAQRNNEQIRITVLEKNASLTDTTACNISPSLTPDEILAVIPPAPVLIEKLGNLSGGSKATNNFIAELKAYNQIKNAPQLREQNLLRLGKYSMQLWQQLYDSADDELQKILRDANFQGCQEPNGYRVDLIYNIPNPVEKAEKMMAVYKNLGYEQCKILSPDEVKLSDPLLADFCNAYSTDNTWHNTATALYRPGGCIDTAIFLPKFYAYLEKIMGTYTNEKSQTKNYFRLKFAREVNQVNITDNKISSIIYDQTTKKHNREYAIDEYVFCPGEAVGTLAKLGFQEPAYAGFAGTSLKLNIPLIKDDKDSTDLIAEYKNFNQYREIHCDDIVLAYQGRIKDNKISIAVGGTKAFYGDKKPNIEHAFAKHSNLLQLNILNKVAPKLLTLALNKDTQQQELSSDDLQQLEEAGIAKRWVGTRAVAYDGFPTWGRLYKDAQPITNARTTTHLGSGGVSFAPIAVLFSKDKIIPANFADSRRSAATINTAPKSKL